MRNLIFLTGAALAVAMTPAAAEAKPKAAKAHLNARGHIDMNRNGVADWRERWIDRNRDGIDDRQQTMMNRWGGDACPPGLAKKSPACIPPGQAKRLFREGQRIGNGYRYYTPYANIPVDYRTTYNLDDDYRYIYRNDYIYEVDPTTSLVRRVISLIL